MVGDQASRNGLKKLKFPGGVCFVRVTVSSWYLSGNKNREGKKNWWQIWNKSLCDSFATLLNMTHLVLMLEF